MPILSINIPSSARRSVFALSAPHTAVLAAATAVAGGNTGLAGMTGASAALTAPGTAGLHNANHTFALGPDMADLSKALAGLTTLDDLLGALKTRHPQDRQAATEHFREALLHDRNVKLAAASSNVGAPGSLASSAYMPDTIQAKLLHFASSDDTDAKWAVVTAVREILKIHSPDAKATARLALALFKVIPCHDTAVMRDAASLLAQLVPLEGMVALANTQCAQALEWLEDSRSDRKRMGAVLLLTELMSRDDCRSIVDNHAPRAIDDIWDHAMTDTNVEIRQAGQQALAACVAALHTEMSYLHCEDLLRMALVPLVSFASSTAAIHGSILTCTVVIDKPDDTNGFALASWEPIMRVKDKDPLVSAAVMDYLAVIARRHPQTFISTMLLPCMKWLIEAIKREKDQVAAFSALAKILPAVPRKAVIGYQDSIIVAFHVALSQPRRSPGLFEALLEAMGGLAETYGPSIEHAINLALDGIFAEGLSLRLVQALTKVVEHIPGLAFVARIKLLDAIAIILSGKTYQEFATPLPALRRASVAVVGPESPRQPTMHRRRSSSLLGIARGRSISPQRPALGSSIPEETSVDLHKLALRTLADFDFGEQPMLLPYFQQHVIGYISAKDASVRSEAIRATSQFLLRRNRPDERSLSVKELVQAILFAGVSDVDSATREYAIGQLDPYFDTFLADPVNSQMLIFALNDAAMPVRLAIIAVLGRICSISSVSILPALRNELAGLLTVLDQTKSSQLRLQTMTVLKHIIDAAPTLAELYSVPIVKVLLELLRTADIEMVSVLGLEITRQLANYAGTALRPHAMDFIHIACDALRDQAHQAKRRMAVLAMTDIVASTACFSELLEQREDYIDLLVTHLASESDPAAKRAVVRALGTIGAMRPKSSSAFMDETKLVQELTDTADNSASSLDRLENGLIPPDEASMRERGPLYIADWVLRRLMDIWGETTLAHLHPLVLEAIVRIFRYEVSSTRSWHYIPVIVGRLITALGEPQVDAVTTCYQVSALGTLARIFQWRIETHVPTILALLLQHWDNGLEPSSCIIDTISAIATALRGDFQKYMSVVLPRMTACLLRTSTSDATAGSILRFLQQTAESTREWTQATIPAVLFACEHYNLPSRLLALDTLLLLAHATYIGSHLSRVMVVLARLSGNAPTSVHATKALCGIVHECRSEAMPIALMYEKRLGFSIVEHPFYVNYTDEKAVSEVDHQLHSSDFFHDISATLDPQTIMSAFVAPTNDEDWPEWLESLCNKLAKATNNHHIRSSAAIGAVYPPLQRNLLNYALFCAWTDLTEDHKSEICDSLHNLLSMDATAEVHDALLHLIGFMDRMGISLNVDPKLCKEAALRRRFLHRACRYAELEYESSGDEAVISDLLRIHHGFQSRQPDHALGLLQLTSSTDFEWAELGEWHRNLNSYDAALNRDPSNPEAVKGVMRCLHALHEWDLLLEYVETKLPSHDAETQSAVAPLVATAAWSAGRHDLMQGAIARMKQPEQAWYSAVSAALKGDQASAVSLIDDARDMLCDQLVKVGRTHTGRGYDVLTRAHLLTELEEVGQYSADPAKRPLIRERWTHRLLNLQKEIEVIGRCMKIRLIAISPTDDIKDMVKYARLCRKAGRTDLAYKVQILIMKGDNGEPLDLSVVAANEYPGLTLERCRLAFELDHQESAKQALRDLILRLSDRLDAMGNMGKQTKKILGKIEAERALLAKAFYSLGDYSRCDDISSLAEAQSCYQKSTDLWPYAKGFRKLASTNLAIIEVLEREHMQSSVEVIHLAVAVIESYAKVIRESDNYPLQDILGLFTTVFKHGQHKDVAVVAERAFATLSIDCWLEAVPQLTAQLNYPSARLQPVIEHHMQRLARAHPHTLLASLAAVAQYPSKERATIAKRLLDIMRLYDDTLVQEALLLNSELMRTSMTWEEQCCHTVEASAKYLFGEGPRNPTGLIAAMEEMCKSFASPETYGEHRFVEKYGDALRVARELGRKCLDSGSDRELASLWRKWHNIHRQCNQGIKDYPLRVELNDVSPRLAALRNMSVHVPGTYVRHTGEDIKLVEVMKSIEILPSKQRPRKIAMRGSDGKTYRFLLKPREDLRLDERCMQLFTLVNSLLQGNQEAAKRHLRIKRFAVVPLSHNAGLLSWFERGDTLQAIVKQHRKITGTPIDLELKLQTNYAPGIAKGTLSSLQLVEVFELALEATKGDEIASILWRKSPSAAAWLERRTAFSRSMATNSMVGHILGLGDRHPSNALQDRITGEVVQIDFGDCFQAAQERDSFPERFPFRLTRQLFHAMGPTGVEGHFRLCSQRVMQILRSNRESIEAVFSSFVHDPLIQHLVLHPRQLDDNGGLADPHGDEMAQIGTPRARFPSRRRKQETSSDKPITQLSPRAQRVVARVREKLEGTEFGSEEPVSVEEQVARLILQATDVYALSSAYQGWCAFW